MLKVAREVAPQANFIQGDMRCLDIEDPAQGRAFESIIISGRSFTHLTTNDDVMNTLSSLYRTLEPEGLLIFDNYRAENIFLHFKNEIIQMAEYDGRKYRRVNRTSMNLTTGWTWTGKATYHIEEPGKDVQVIEDEQILRAFTEDELKLFLHLNNFKIIEVLAEDTITIVAKKPRD